MLNEYTIYFAIAALTIAFTVVIFIAAISYIENLRNRIYELEEMNDSLVEALNDSKNHYNCNI